MKTIKRLATIDVKAIPGVPNTLSSSHVLGVTETPNLNVAIVITSVIAIEQVLCSIISHYFLGAHPKRIEFEEEVLGSRGFDLGAKLALVLHISKQNALMTKNEIKALEQQMHKAIDYRNAFAHGKLRLSIDKVSLWHFKGGTKETELTDEFLTEVEEALFNAWGSATLLAKRVEEKAV